VYKPKQILLACLFSLLACNFLAAQTTLRVAAAADLQPVLPSLVAQFEQSTGMHLAVSYASSATLATQILNGAPFDVFLAADKSFPQRVITAGLADETAPVVYAHGTLVLWARKDQIHDALSMQLLLRPAITRIAVANPNHAPYGRAAIAALHGLGLFDKLQNKLVYAENIAQTAQYAASGNTQCGLISQTSAETATLRSVGTFVVVPATAYPPIEQGAIVLRHAPQHAAAVKFLQFVLSPDGQTLLAAGGLTRVR
jgi:molybdate transport system substrate-binding protein